MRSGRAKAWFLTGSVAVTSVIGLGCAAVATRTATPWPWVWAAVAALAYPLRVGAYYVMPQRTTPRNMPGLLGVSAFALALTVISVAQHGEALAIGAAWSGPLGAVAYVFWYSRLGRARSARIAAGETLPDVSFVREDGATLRASDLRGGRVLFLFYRGNWCPLCMAQVREVAGQYRALEARGVKVAVVSPQPHENSQALARRFDAPMLFLTDPKAAAARALGIVHEGGLPAGFEVLGYDTDTVLPTVVLVEADGTVLWADETDNYRVRPDPQTFLGVLDAVDAKRLAQRA